VQDLETQRSSGTAPLTRITTAQSEYSRSGRGGAGNLVSAAEAAASLPVTKMPIVAKKETFPGHVGRGGAGNWRVNLEEERRQQEEAEKNARSRVDEQVRVEVEMELQPPPKAYKAAGLGNVRD